MMTEWRKSPTVAAVIVALFVILQFVIPISRSSDGEHPERFGWQMFSSAGEAIEFSVHTATGTLVIDLQEVMANPRGDIPLEELLPTHLCETVDGAAFVTWNDKRYEC